MCPRCAGMRVVHAAGIGVVPCPKCGHENRAAPICGPCFGTGQVANLSFTSEQRTMDCPECGGLGIRLPRAALEAIRNARHAGEA